MKVSLSATKLGYMRLNLYGESIDDLQQKYQNNNEAEDNK